MFNKSSLLDVKPISKEDFKQSAFDKLKSILVDKFSDNYQKQQIKVQRNRFNFACPFCGDSTVDSSKKRGNLLLSGQWANTYKCFNCGTFMPIDKFFRQFDADYQLNISELTYVAENKFEFTDNVSMDDSKMLAMLIDIHLLNKVAVDRELYKAKLKLVDASAHQDSYTFLKNRMQYNFKNYLYDPVRGELHILNLTNEDKVIGLQTRNIFKKIFKTYNTTTMYTILFKETPPKEITKYVDDISMLFNVCKVNLNKPVIVTEGPMDAFLIKNSIAIIGSHKNVNIFMDYYFLYDEDEAGTESAVKALEEGFKVFLWKRFRQEHNIPKRNKWDWNDIVLYCKENGIRINNIKNYFSNDSLDMLYI